jgi:hypothetical protein
LYTDELVLEILLEKFPNKNVEEFSASYKNRQWIFTFIIPIIIFIKCNLIATCLTTGAFIGNYKIDYRKYLGIAVIGEFAFLIPILIKFLWFLLIQINFDYYDLRNFTTFSLYDLLSENGLEFWYAYPLKLLNVFEILYIIILSFQISNYLSLTFPQSVIFVLSTYVAGLCLWMLFISFIVLSIS